jgi:hypothetical protein
LSISGRQSSDAVCRAYACEIIALRKTDQRLVSHDGLACPNDLISFQSPCRAVHHVLYATPNKEQHGHASPCLQNAILLSHSKNTHTPGQRNTQKTLQHRAQPADQCAISASPSTAVITERSSVHTHRRLATAVVVAESRF